MSMTVTSGPEVVAMATAAAARTRPSESNVRFIANPPSEITAAMASKLYANGTGGALRVRLPPLGRNGIVPGHRRRAARPTDPGSKRTRPEPSESGRLGSPRCFRARRRYGSKRSPVNGVRSLPLDRPLASYGSAWRVTSFGYTPQQLAVERRGP